MADYEVSKLMWMGIVIALAMGVFAIAQPQIRSLTNGALNTVSKVVNPSNSDNSGATVTKINPDDAKWIQKGNYGTNGYFVRDKDGNGIVYAIDPQKPVIAPETAVFTQGNQDLTSLRFLDKTILPKNCNNYFAGNNLKTFDTKNLDTSNVTDMSMMFSSMGALTALDVSKFDTSKVTNMSGMFNYTLALTTLDVSNFNTSNVTDMSGMFSNMIALTTLDVSNFNTSNVTNMSAMFVGMHALTTLDVSKFDTSNVTDVYGMFGDRDTLTRPDTSKFDTSKMTNKDQMFDSLQNMPEPELR